MVKTPKVGSVFKEIHTDVADRQHAQDRFRERITVERVCSRLKDEFDGRHVLVCGAEKVMAHLMLGLLALTIDQVLELTGLKSSKRAQ